MASMFARYINFERIFSKTERVFRNLILKDTMRTVKEFVVKLYNSQSSNITNMGNGKRCTYNQHAEYIVIIYIFITGVNKQDSINNQ